MYVLVAFAITVVVIAVAWRGLGFTQHGGQDSEDHSDDPRPRLSRPQRPRPKRVVAPDDDPEFLSEIDRKLREDGKNNN